MVQAIINLSEEEDKFINIYKAQRGIKSKNQAIKEMIQERIEQEKEDLEFAKRTEIILEKHLLKENRKSYSKEEFLNEMKKW